MLKRVTTYIAAGQRLCRLLVLALLGYARGLRSLFPAFLEFSGVERLPGGG